MEIQRDDSRPRKSRVAITVEVEKINAHLMNGATIEHQCCSSRRTAFGVLRLDGDVHVFLDDPDQCAAMREHLYAIETFLRSQYVSAKGVA